MAKKTEQLELKMLDYIKDYIDTNGFPPSYREIGKFCNMRSTNTIKYHMDLLENKGLITRTANKNRTIDVISRKEQKKETDDLLSVPLVGKVTAGIPILAEENYEDTFKISKSLFKATNDIFLLRVSGESMMGAGIEDEDLIVVNRQNYAENGDIVCAYLDGYATIKAFYREPTRIRLQPRNDRFSPIFTNSVQILGKVIGIIRSIY